MSGTTQAPIFSAMPEGKGARCFDCKEQINPGDKYALDTRQIPSVVNDTHVPIHAACHRRRVVSTIEALKRRQVRQENYLREVDEELTPTRVISGHVYYQASRDDACTTCNRSADVHATIGVCAYPDTHDCPRGTSCLLTHGEPVAV